MDVSQTYQHIDIAPPRVISTQFTPKYFHFYNIFKAQPKTLQTSSAKVTWETLQYFLMTSFSSISIQHIKSTFLTFLIQCFITYWKKLIKCQSIKTSMHQNMSIFSLDCCSNKCAWHGLELDDSLWFPHVATPPDLPFIIYIFNYS